MKNTEFIESVLKPYYQSFSHSNMELGVREIGGGTIFVTEKYAYALKDNMTVNEILAHKPTSESDLCNSEIVKFCRQLDARMLDNPGLQEFMVRDVRNDGAISLGQNTPIFTPDGKCFGFQFIYQSCLKNIFINELLDRQIKLFNTKVISLENIYSIELSDLEEKVLSLLLLGYTQAQIATDFNCSRSYIAKIIAENLCPKFGIQGFSSRLLVDKAIELGYANFIPKSILMPK